MLEQSPRIWRPSTTFTVILTIRKIYGIIIEQDSNSHEMIIEQDSLSTRILYRLLRKVQDPKYPAVIFLTFMRNPRDPTVIFLSKIQDPRGAAVMLPVQDARSQDL